MPDSFQPDSFTADEPDSFVADSFVADAPAKVESDWRTGGVLDPNKNWRQRLDVLLSGPDQLRDAFGKPDSTSLLPTFKQPETYAGGFFNSLYNDFVRPLASPEGFIGSSVPGKMPPVRIADEVLPAEAPVIRGLLTAPEDPLIAGQAGRLQRRSLITPQEEARLAGYPDNVTGPMSTGDRSFGTTLDIAELRERERLANLNFTNYELEGGRALEVPNTPKPDLPTTYDVAPGNFNRASNADLPYPLNITPEVLRPRSVNNVFEALYSDRVPNVGEELPLTGVKSAPIEKPVTPKLERDLAGGTAAVEPGEPILPSAVKATRSRVKAETGLNVPPKIEVSPNVPKPVADGVKAGVANFVKAAGTPSSMLKSVYTQLSELGPAGKELVQRFQRAAQNRAEYDAAWTEPLFAAGARLSKSEFSNFGAYVEGRMPIPNARVQKAVDAWRASESMMADMAETKGLHLKREGNVIPFERISEGYWPHQPAEGLTKKSIVDKLVAEGMSRADAANVAKRWEKTGEIFLRGQHSRLDRAFAYRDDFDVAIAHGRSMSKRIANHENLGPKDIAGKGDAGIANLIEDTDNPNLALTLAKRLAGRDELPNEKLVNGLNQARKWMSLTSLPNFTLPNIPLGQAMNAQMAILSRHPLEAVKEVSKLFSSAYRNEIRASGAFNTFNRTLAEELHGIDPFQIGVGEKINRSVAAAVGRSTVRTAFNDFKQSADPHAKQLLEMLLSRPAESIEAMTPELERFAAGRMAEITQGLNNPGNLPYAWSNPVNNYTEVARQLTLIFKKIGFQTTKTVKDSIMMQPTIPTKIAAATAWAAIAQVAGEMVGDIKSGLTGKERPEDLMRVADNWGNAFMLGLPWDLATSAQYGPSAMLSATAGPFFGKVSELGNDIYRTGANVVSGQEDPFAPLRRFGIRNLPVPARERIKETEIY